MKDAYFLYHSIGQYPAKETDLATAMAAFAKVWAAPDDRQWGYLLGQRQRFIDRWRGIINAPQGTVTTCESVTHGLHMLLTAIPHRLKGRRVLVAADCFPSNHFLLTELARRHGFTLDTVPLRQGSAHVESEDFAAHWGPDVALALLTWVSSTTSHRIDKKGAAFAAPFAGQVGRYLRAWPRPWSAARRRGWSIPTRCRTS